MLLFTNTIEKSRVSGGKFMRTLVVEDEKHLNRMLFELKSRKVQIDLKAILTPTNRRWTLRQLHDELKRERASFT